MILQFTLVQLLHLEHATKRCIHTPIHMMINIVQMLFVHFLMLCKNLNITNGQSSASDIEQMTDATDHCYSLATAHYIDWNIICIF